MLNILHAILIAMQNPISYKFVCYFAQYFIHLCISLHDWRFCMNIDFPKYILILITFSMLQVDMDTLDLLKASSWRDFGTLWVLENWIGTANNKRLEKGLGGKAYWGEQKNKGYASYTKLKMGITIPIRWSCDHVNNWSIYTNYVCICNDGS